MEKYLGTKFGNFNGGFVMKIMCTIIIMKKFWNSEIPTLECVGGNLSYNYSDITRQKFSTYFSLDHNFFFPGRDMKILSKKCSKFYAEKENKIIKKIDGYCLTTNLTTPFRIRPHPVTIPARSSIKTINLLR